MNRDIDLLEGFFNPHLRIAKLIIAPDQIFKAIQLHFSISRDKAILEAGVWFVRTHINYSQVIGHAEHFPYIDRFHNEFFDLEKSRMLKEGLAFHAGPIYIRNGELEIDGVLTVGQFEEVCKEICAFKDAPRRPMTDDDFDKVMS